jgi:two-component sensor histidine kinase
MIDKSNKIINAHTRLPVSNPIGFGLQLIKMLVNQLKGKLKIEVNHGTRFIIEFTQ